MDDNPTRPPSRLRAYAAPLLLLAIVLAAAVMFHHVLLPFLIALFIAYIIEPVVQRITETEVKGRSLPRGGAVLVVYAVLFGFVATTGAFFVPQFAREIGSLGADAPRFLQEVREEHLPAFEERLNQFLSNFEGSQPSSFDVTDAREVVADAVDRAAVTAVLAAGMTPYERELVQADPSAVAHYVVPREADDALLHVRPAVGGGYDIVVDADEIYVEHVEEGQYALRLAEPSDGSAVELERALDEQLNGLVETSGEIAGHLIGAGQRFVTGLFGFIVMFVVTFMVAAFISIDAPGIVRFGRSLFPEEAQPAVDTLLKALDKGLAGVIRGQLTIALVNGILTTLGLAILGVPFALILGLIAGAFSLIPIFGTIISSFPAVILGLTQSLMTGVLVLGWIIGIHFLEGNILNPKIIGTAAEIHPAIVVFALLAGEHTFGLAGALLAVPTASILQTIFLFLRESVWAPQPVSEPDES